MTPDMAGFQPFERSIIPPTSIERAVANLIWPRKRPVPISIEKIIASIGAPYCPLSARKVKEVVEQLRLTHHCAIGASREAPAGYFWIRTAEDRETAVRPYRAQILSMWRTLRALDSPHAMRELHGQLRLEAES